MVYYDINLIKLFPDIISEAESKVKTLQATLFPPQLTHSGSYFSNFLIKTPFEEDEDSKYKVKDAPSREWFLNNKEADFTTQPARWPTECQVNDIAITRSLSTSFIRSKNSCLYIRTGMK